MMTLGTVDRIRLASVLFGAAIALSVVILALADLPSLPAGVVCLILIAVAGLSGLYRYLSAGALVFGIAVYFVLERGQDGGFLVWIVAALCFIVTAAATELLSYSLRAGEKHQIQTRQIMDELTMYDTASGLLKQRYGERALEEEIQRARRTHSEVTLILAGFDPVPEYPTDVPPDSNEEAEIVGAVFRDVLRLTDRSTRLGPSLFAAVLPSTGPEGGVAVARKIQPAVEMRGIRPLRCGVVTFPENGVSAQELLDEADAALSLARAGNMWLVSPSMLS